MIHAGTERRIPQHIMSAFASRSLAFLCVGGLFGAAFARQKGHAMGVSDALSGQHGLHICTRHMRGSRCVQETGKLRRARVHERHERDLITQFERFANRLSCPSIVG